MSAATILVGIILVSLVLITTVGNILVCLSVVLVRKLRKPQNYLLVSLAVSDLCVSLFVMPFAIVFELNKASWPLSDGLCDLYVSADVLSCTASILNLCAISVDRYQAITRPLEYSGASSPRRMLAVIFSIWLSAACVSLPPVLLLGNEHENHDCTVSQNFWYQIYATIVSFYGPLCVMLVVYAKILRVVADKKKQMTWTNNSRNSSVDRSAIHDMHYLQGAGRTEGGPLSSSIPSTSSHNHDRQESSNPWTRGSIKLNSTLLNQNPVQLRIHQAPRRHSQHRHSSKKRQQQQQQNQQTQSDRISEESHGQSFCFQKFRPMRLKDHKASTTLGLVMGAFIFCWLPFFVLALIRPFAEVDTIPPWVTSLFLWLGYANSSLNPFIYAITNRDFRRPFREILCFRCSTLDDLMRREFYDHQYGGDEYCVRNKKKLPVGSNISGSGGGGGPLSPTSPISETNILANNIITNNTNSISNPLPPIPMIDSSSITSQNPSQVQSRVQSQNNTPLKLQNPNVNANSINSNGGGQETGSSSPRLSSNNPNRSPWMMRNNLNKTFETQLTTDVVDPETEVVESESVVLSVI